MHIQFSSRLNYSLPILLSLTLGIQLYGTRVFAEPATHIVAISAVHVLTNGSHPCITNTKAPAVHNEVKTGSAVINSVSPQHAGAVVSSNGNLVLQRGQKIDSDCSNSLASSILRQDNHLNKLIKEDAGDLSGKYQQLSATVSSIRSQEQCDAAQNGGHITVAEFKQLNGEEKSVAQQIAKDNYGAGDAAFKLAHAGRSEVLGRDAHLNQLIKEDAGDLSGKFTQLMAKDNSIRSQEQSDAAKNGGHLTAAEYKQLNGEENSLAKQIAADNSGAGDSAFKTNHPLRSEVLGRDAHLSKLIKEDAGDLSGKYSQLMAKDNSIRSQEQSDAAKNGGHLTAAEYKQFNGEENKLAKQIAADNSGAGDAAFKWTHPLRSEVLGRDAHLANLIKEDAGDLSGKYTQLMTQDNSIRSQEQSDAAKNGGVLTSAEFKQLNAEENSLAKQIAKDNSGAGDAAFKAAHPRRSEVLGRDASLSSLIKEDAGDLSGKYSQLMAKDNSIRSQEQHDAAMNGGHLTKAEYIQLNNEENSLAKQIAHDNSGAGDTAFQTAHPLRSEVLGRDAGLSNLIKQEKGHLSGQFGALNGTDLAIQAQEQSDARANGGYLTIQQTLQLNGEENALQASILSDLSKQ